MLFRIEALHSDGYYEKSPDVVSYNCVINAYAHGRGVVHRLENGKRLLERMQSRGIEANEITYNTLLRCVLKEMDGASESLSVREEKVENAESILSTMEEMKLSNTRSYNTMISILSKSQLPNSAQKAEEWLRHIMHQYDTTNEERFEPDVYSFNSVIHAYANSIDGSKKEVMTKHATKAEELLNEMESCDLENVHPDVISYSAVINAYARAASRGSEWCVDRAVEMLDRLEENLVHGGKRSVKPNKRTYSAVSA